MQGDNLYSILDYFENNDNKNKDVMIYNASFIMNIFKAHNVIVERSTPIEKHIPATVGFISLVIQ